MALSSRELLIFSFCSGGGDLGDGELWVDVLV